MEERKVALITGGSRGIGKSIAEKFAKEGYNLVINYVSESTNIEELTKEIKQIAENDQRKSYFRRRDWN